MKKILGILIALAILMLVGSVSRPNNIIPVSSCGVLNKASGVYVLTQDIQTSSSPCIDIQANNIIFNGNGHSINANGIGINLNAHNGVIIQNIRAYSSSVGGQSIRIINGGNNQVIGVISSATGSGGIGLYLESTSGNSVTNSTMTGDNYGTGIYFDSQSVNNIVATSNMHGYWFGAYFASYSNNNVISNSALDGDQGVTIDLSSNNMIANNIITGSSYGAKVEDSSANNLITGNSISAESVAISSSFSGVNTFTFNNITNSPVWIYEMGSANIYSKNAYYLSDGTPSWRVFQMLDNSGDNYADVGTGVPVNSANEAEYVYGSASDLHPFTTIHIKNQGC